MMLPDEKIRPDGEATFGPEPLRLAGVSVFAGEPPKPVLRNIHLSVGPGEWVTLAGANGSGKSTLIGIIAGLIEPDDGQVSRGFAGGGPIPCVIQQVGPFIGDTPWEEMLFALEERGLAAGDHTDVPALRIAEKALAATGLYPHRHRPIAALSGGQRQLLSIAASLIPEAPLILFDEATAMLDVQSRRLVMETARRLHRGGAAVLWSTHRLDEAVPGGRMVVLKDGEIAFDGPAEDFFYRTGADGRTLCESAGFVPPFAVRTAKALKRRGWVTKSRPLCGEQLAASLRTEARGRAEMPEHAIVRGNAGLGKHEAAQGRPGIPNPADARQTASISERNGNRTERAMGVPEGKAETAGIRVERAALSIGGKPVLAGVDAVFPAGTITLLIGPCGAGKTMLLEMMAGLRKPDGGKVHIDGIPLWQGNKPDPRLLRRIGLVTQNPEQMLFARTVREEFAYSLRPCGWPKKQNLAAMERAAARWFGGGGSGTRASGTGGGLSRPGGPAEGGGAENGLAGAEETDRSGGKSGRNRAKNDWLEADPLALSGGERRRLALAVTDVAEPDWLLLDEPTAGLDRSMLERLRQRLRHRRAEGRGAVVVTHNAEEWFDMADGIVLMREGRVVWAGAPAELAENPKLWQAAGMELPEPFRTLETLRRAGFRIPRGLPDPGTLAEVLAARPLPEHQEKGANAGELAAERNMPAVLPTVNRPPGQRDPTRPENAADPANPENAAIPADPAKESALTETFGLTDSAKPAETHPAKTPLANCDPRALWLACLAVTAGIGIQTSWAGWLLGAAVSFFAIRFSGVPPRVFLRPAKALLLFTLVTSLAAGWELASSPPGGGFDVPAAVETFRRFSKLVMMALLGFSLMAGISPPRLKRSLDQGLRPLAAIGVPVGRFTLASALLLRFLPLLFEAWDRFARIAASRGKRPVKPGSVPPSLIVMTVVPFLLAMIRLGESLAAVLAVRGAGGTVTRSGMGLTKGARARKGEGKMGLRPMRLPQNGFTRGDWHLLVSAAALLAVFLLIRKTC